MGQPHDLSQIRLFTTPRNAEKLWKALEAVVISTISQCMHFRGSRYMNVLEYKVCSKLLARNYVKCNVVRGRKVLPSPAGTARDC